MDSINELLTILEGPESNRKPTKAKKRKWREIEALKDKHKLRKELQELDLFSDGIGLEELEF